MIVDPRQAPTPARRLRTWRTTSKAAAAPAKDEEVAKLDVEAAVVDVEAAASLLAAAKQRQLDVEAAAAARAMASLAGSTLRAVLAPAPATKHDTQTDLRAAEGAVPQ